MTELYNTLYPTKPLPAFWRTPNTQALALAVLQDKDLDLMPVLADAMADAGCDDDEVLKYLRERRDLWSTRGWVLRGLTASRVIR